MVIEYQKSINLLDNTPTQPANFRTKIWVEMNDELHRVYNANGQIEFKTSMLRTSVLSLCDYSDTYILVSGTITVAALVASGGNNVIQEVFKNCTSFTNYINKINNAQKDNAKNIEVTMSMHNLIEYGDNYSKHPKVHGNTTEMKES